MEQCKAIIQKYYGQKIYFKSVSNVIRRNVESIEKNIEHTDYYLKCQNLQNSLLPSSNF